MGKYKYSFKNKKDVQGIKHGEVRCCFNISQRIIDKLTNECASYVDTNSRPDLFSCKLYIIDGHNIMIISVSSIHKLELTSNYFNKYLLMTSKYWNYLCYLQGFNYIKKRLSDHEINEIQIIKNSMNTKITYYNWVLHIS